MSIRGIQCILPQHELDEFLHLLINDDAQTYIPYCMLLAREAHLPYIVKDGKITLSQIFEESIASVWELVLHVYPQHSPERGFITYSEFLSSQAMYCVLFYDCNYLEIYLKDYIETDIIMEQLLQMGAEEVEVIPFQGNGRSELTL